MNMRVLAFVLLIFLQGIQLVFSVNHDYNVQFDYFFTNAQDRELVAAVKRGQTEIIKRLIDQGADPHFHDKCGINLLHLAAWYGHIELVKLFVEEHKIDICSSGYFEYWTPLCCALKNKHKEIVDYLIQKDIRVFKSFLNRFDEAGLQALQEVIQSFDESYYKQELLKKIDRYKRFPFTQCLIS